MTVAVAWVRRIRHCEELVVVSDSRLSGGRTIDCCQKVLSLPRSDSFLCFAGDSQFGYPLMQQAITSVLSYGRAKDRSLDIYDFKGHLLKVFNHLLEFVESPVPEMEIPEASFIFGGYSWQQKCFDVWRIEFDRKLKSFVAKPAKRWTGSRTPLVFAGDLGPQARKRLIKLIRDRHGVFPNSEAEFHFDWEPFEAVRDLLREAACDEATRGQRSWSIGGAPQVLKVYQHMNSRSLGVFWPDKVRGQIFIAGRGILGYERPDMWILDPDTLRSSHLVFSREAVPVDEEGEMEAASGRTGESETRRESQV